MRANPTIHTPNAATTTELNRDICSNTRGLQIDVNAAYNLHRRATVYLKIANLTADPSYRDNNNTAFMNRHGAFGARFGQWVSLLLHGTVGAGLPCDNSGHKASPTTN